MKPGTLSFTTAALTALAVLGMAVAAIWTGDGRWGYTALFLSVAALVLVVVGSARAAAAEKRSQERRSAGRLLEPGGTASLNRTCRSEPIVPIFPPNNLPTEKWGQRSE